jgi:hypothetical protein
VRNLINLRIPQLSDKLNTIITKITYRVFAQ